MSENVFHMFSSKTFMVSYLKFNLQAILSLFLCMMWECIITSLICGSPPFPTSLTGETVFAPLYILAWSCWCFSHQSWIQLVTHPAQHFSRCSAHRLSKQCDNRQPCHTPFLILNQTGVPYRVLTVSSWPTYRSLRRHLTYK